MMAYVFDIYKEGKKVTQINVVANSCDKARDWLLDESRYGNKEIWTIKLVNDFCVYIAD